MINCFEGSSALKAAPVLISTHDFFACAAF